tara:strand:- start:1949 stop:2065 length:117 start_codon:yes stop_codon:yes gene_type:complete
MIKDIWNKINLYSLSKRGKIAAAALAIIIVLVIVGWAA